MLLHLDKSGDETCMEVSHTLHKGQPLELDCISVPRTTVALGSVSCL